MKIRLIAVSAVLGICTVCHAQSESFRLGKWVEIHSSILKELSRSYVDSLPLDKIGRAHV